jgi:Cystathionine beta-lyases/cystathionine gamma-synthases
MSPASKTSCIEIACGKPIPTHTPHAVSVSLPTIADVLAYKENKNSWRNRIVSGYPRFYTHPFEQMASAFIRKQLGIRSDQQILLMPSARCAQHVLDFAEEKFPILHLDGLTFLAIPENNEHLFDILTFIRRTGCKAYTRQIEDFLVNHQLLDTFFQEDVVEVDPEDSIKATLGKHYRIDKEQIYLYSSGMNALFSIYTALKVLGRQNRRNIFVQLGHIYFDTEEMLKSYSEEYICIESVYSLKELDAVLKEKGSAVAAIFTEIPTNPFLDICDLPLLRELSSCYGIPLAVDITMGPPINLDVLSFCDVVVESLTKFASGSGEVMGGTAILNPNSPIYTALSMELPQWGEPFYIRDAQRLAYTIKGYSLRVTWACESVEALVSYLNNHPKVKKVYWSHSPENIESYKKVERTHNRYSPVISIEFDFPLEKIYDRLQLPKGPSLGPDFTLAMPYFYMANYDLMKTSEGKQVLKDKGINPELLRISIGCESIQQLIGIFADALDF